MTDDLPLFQQPRFDGATYDHPRDGARPKKPNRALQGFPDDYTRIPLRTFPTQRITKTRPEPAPTVR